jgi:hypothetical protein
LTTRTILLTFLTNTHKHYKSATEIQYGHGTVVAEVLHKRHSDNPSNGDTINRGSSADREQGLPFCVFLTNCFWRGNFNFAYFIADDTPTKSA